MGLDYYKSRDIGWRIQKGSGLIYLSDDSRDPDGPIELTKEDEFIHPICEDPQSINSTDEADAFLASRAVEQGVPPAIVRPLLATGLTGDSLNEEGLLAELSLGSPPSGSGGLTRKQGYSPK